MSRPQNYRRSTAVRNERSIKYVRDHLKDRNACWVYANIVYEYYESKGCCDKSQKDLLEYTSIKKVDTLNTHLKTLIDNGYLRVESGKDKNTRNRYYPTFFDFDPADQENNQNSENEEGAEISPSYTPKNGYQYSNNWDTSTPKNGVRDSNNRDTTLSPYISPSSLSNEIDTNIDNSSWGETTDQADHNVVSLQEVKRSQKQAPTKSQQPNLHMLKELNRYLSNDTKPEVEAVEKALAIIAAHSDETQVCDKLDRHTVEEGLKGFYDHRNFAWDASLMSDVISKIAKGVKKSQFSAYLQNVDSHWISPKLPFHGFFEDPKLLPQKSEEDIVRDLIGIMRLHLDGIRKKGVACAAVMELLNGKASQIAVG